MKTKSRDRIRKMTVIAIMAALATILRFLEFSVPFLPEFLKFDFSDLPAYLCSFSVGPLSGIIVELIKNTVLLPFSSTSFVGELANFLIGAALVFPAGMIYRYKKTKKGAVIGSAAGTIFAGIISFPVNLFITYPFYTKFIPLDGIIGMYHALFPTIDTLPEALLLVNVPFTIVKGAVNVIITFFIYKPLSPLLKGKNH